MVFVFLFACGWSVSSSRNNSIRLKFGTNVYVLCKISYVVFVVQSIKKKLFECKLSYRNETGNNHHGLLSTSVWCFKIFLRGASTWGSLPNFNFFNVNPQIFQRNRKVHLSNYLETNFHDIPNISLRDIKRRNYR